MEREATPQPLMELSIHLHAAEISISDTVSVLDSFGVDRCLAIVHNWLRKADLEPEDSKSPTRVAMDETVIHLNDDRFWLLAAVDSVTTEFLHIRLYPACTIALTERILRELGAKHDVDDALFLVDGAPWLQAALHRYGYRFRHETRGSRKVAERVYKEIKQRTNQFLYHFRRLRRLYRVVAANARIRLETGNLNNASGASVVAVGWVFANTAGRDCRNQYNGY